MPKNCYQWLNYGEEGQLGLEAANDKVNSCDIIREIDWTCKTNGFIDIDQDLEIGRSRFVHDV